VGRSQRRALDNCPCPGVPQSRRASPRLLYP
jgi:hypothetical protein